MFLKTAHAGCFVCPMPLQVRHKRAGSTDLASTSQQRKQHEAQRAPSRMTRDTLRSRSSSIGLQCGRLGDEGGGGAVHGARAVQAGACARHPGAGPRGHHHPVPHW